MATVSEESDTHLNAGSCIFSDCLQVSHLVRKCKLPVRGDEPGADIAAGKDACAQKYDLENLFNGLPECDEGMTHARFVKTRVIIHVPAGSADRMLPVVPD